MSFDNKIHISFPSRPRNTAFARICVSAFIAPLDPSIGDISDIKTAVSEAVTNCVVHAYEDSSGIIEMDMTLEERTFMVSIKDFGCGMENIERSMRPLYTTKPDEERTGMGFTIMEAFMDNVDVFSEKGSGTTVKMLKYIPEGRKSHE